MAFQALSKWISSAYLDPEQLEALAMAGFLEMALRIMSSSFWADWKTGFSGERSEMFSAAHIGSNWELLVLCLAARALRCGNLLPSNGIESVHRMQQ